MEQALLITLIFGTLPMLTFAWMSVCVFAIGLSLFAHSSVLQSKHAHLKTETDAVKHTVQATPLYYRGTRSGQRNLAFFDNLAPIKEGLEALTLSNALNP